MPISLDEVRSRVCENLRVDPEQVIFKRDGETDSERVVLLLRDSQVDWALQGNGMLVRRLAMDLEIDIEIGADA